MVETDTNFFSELERDLAGANRDEGQDRLSEFVSDRADDNSVVAPLMGLVDNLEKVRRYYALDAFVFICLHAPEKSELQKAALAKWGEVIERIADKDIFEALEWASHPPLFGDAESMLAAQGISKWCDLIDRAAAIDPARALKHARDMAEAEPWNPFAIIAGLSADGIEGEMKQKAARQQPPPAPPPAFC